MTRTGRPREFDRDETVARARDLFWDRGYANTSVQDLVDGLGVQRGSLYGAFGDKHGLYLEAVGLYWHEQRARLEHMLEQDPLLPALRQILLEPGTVTSENGRRGCLIGNTATQLYSADGEARAVVEGAFDTFMTILSEACRRAQKTGEVTSAVDPRTQALLLLVLFQGSALVSRVLDEPSHQAAVIDLALSALRP